MLKFKKDYKKLYKTYKKRLADINAHSVNNLLPPTQYFVTYLQLLRDRLLLESPLTASLGTDNIELASIVTALSEFENYQKCIHNYYIVTGNVAVRRSEFTEEEAAIKYQEERSQHWEAFWNLVKLCIEGWGVDAEL